MSVRNAVLSVGTVLVLGLGVYLLLAVRAETAGPPRTASPVAVERPAPPAAPPVTPAESPSAPPAPTAGGAPAWIRPRPGTPTGTPAAAPAPAAADPAGDADLSGPKLDLVMAEANKAYDRGDYDEAKTVAARVLAREPGNVRMLRIMVSASCIDGDTTTATASYVKLPPGDQAQMRTRCLRYGVAFPEN